MLIKNDTNTHKSVKVVFFGSLCIVLIGIYFISRQIWHTNTANRNEVLESAIQNNQEEDVPYIETEVLVKQKERGQKITIFDIRSENAFNYEHIAHSQNIPISALDGIVFDQSSTTVIVADKADYATFETAKNILKKKSSPYFFLRGGLIEWKKKNAPLVSIAQIDSFIDQSKVTFISPEMLKKLQQETRPPFILDIQPKEKYAKKHIQGAINIPFSELEKRSMEIPPATLIVVYGENDIRSFEGGALLSDLGIFSVQTLSGNTYLLPESGLSLEP